MKKMLLVIGLVAFGAIGFAWWTASRPQAGEPRDPSRGDGTSLPTNGDASRRVIHVHRPDEVPSSSHRRDPVIVTPCSIMPAREQTVSAQVDGILEELLVELGEQVSKGTVLARLHDRHIRVQTELLRIRAASDSAERIARAQYDEADSRVSYAIRANASGLQSVPELEYKTYLFQRERYAQEIKKAREEQEIARKELEKATVLLEQHAIQSDMAGQVVRVFKRPGEAVKQAEPVFRVANSQTLRLEGLCKAQQAELLRVGMTTIVEPEVRGEQLTELAGHTGAVNSLAVSSDGRLLASASEDRSVVVWSWPEGRRVCLLPHPGEVNAAAFVPGDKTQEGARILTGCGDGHVRLWHIPLVGDVPQPIVFSTTHDAPVRCVAVSADGKWCASGGEDRRIGVWDARTGRHLYWLESEGSSTAHKGAVTSVGFLPPHPALSPSGGEGHLVSAGRDNSLRVWSIGATRGEQLDDVGGRTGEVTQFGLSRDGRHVLFDHGEELRILVRESWDSAGTLRGQRQGRFTGLAHFSPSGTLVLTANTNGRIGLWRAPMAATAPTDPGGSELRYFMAPSAGPVLCGAFAPDDTICFTAGADKVIRAWPVPPPADWRTPLTAKITYVGSQVERGADTVRVRAEMSNPTELGRRLRPGSFATLKIYPQP